jgi:hypothetical protein
MPKKGQGKQLREARVVYTADEETADSAARLAVADGDWVQANHARLERKYPGRWIAVHNRRVVGAGIRLSTALKQARAHGVEHPLVTAFRPARLQALPEVAQWL